MPIELNKIPKIIRVPEPPNALRWFVIIILITLLGILLALYIWPDTMTTHSAWFWFCILAIPLSCGLICYAFRLRAYENERDRVNYWNRLHQEQREIQVIKGQRSAGLLGKAYITPIACNKLVSALMNYGSPLQSAYFTHLQRTLTTARLGPLEIHLSEQSYSPRLADYISTLIRMLEPDLSRLPIDSLSVRLRHDGALDNAQITRVWQTLFPASYAVNELIVEAGGDGMMWLDAWLDRREAMIMLSVEINLFTEPRDYQSESVSAILLASPEWLAQRDIVPEAVIHRPVVATEDISSLEDTLRWGKLSADEEYIFWRGQIETDALTTLIQQAEKMGYLAGQSESYILEDLFGKPGAATGNIALLCACEHAITSGKPQWVMIADKTMHQAIVRQAEC